MTRRHYILVCWWLSRAGLGFCRRCCSADARSRVRGRATDRRACERDGCLDGSAADKLSGGPGLNIPSRAINLDLRPATATSTEGLGGFARLLTPPGIRSD